MGSRAGGRAATATAVAAALLLCAGLAGCSQNLIGTLCLPAPLRVSPAAATPGEVISVSSGPADCDLGYGPRHSYTVQLVRPHLASPSVSVEPAADGRFSVELPVPPGFPSGEATVVVTGSPFDHCDDTGLGSCAGYTAPAHIR